MNDRTDVVLRSNNKQFRPLIFHLDTIISLINSTYGYNSRAGSFTSAYRNYLMAGFSGSETFSTANTEKACIFPARRNARSPGTHSRFLYLAFSSNENAVSAGHNGSIVGFSANLDLIYMKTCDEMANR